MLFEKLEFTSLMNLGDCLNDQGPLGANLQKFSVLFALLGHFNYRVRWTGIVGG